MTRRRLLLAAIALTLAGVVLVATITQGRGRGGAAAHAPPPAHAVRGAFRLAALPGDGTVWLSWLAQSGCAAYRVERTTDPGHASWETAIQTAALNFKDINRLNRMQLWYRVAATRCRAADSRSDIVPVAPTVSPYSWDFGRQMEGVSGTSEGWVSATSTPARPRSGQLRKSGAGVLTVDSVAGEPTVVSPDGLNMSAASYHHLVVGVVDSYPPTLSIRWLVTGRPAWTQPVSCPLTKGSGGSTTCNIDLASTPQWSAQIRQIELSFPGATGPLNVDRVHFDRGPTAKPLVGAIRWDGWFPDNFDGRSVDPSMMTDFDFRRPFYGWLDAPGPSALPPNATHPASLPQHQLDMMQELQQANTGGIDFWAFNWYLGQPEIPRAPNGPSPFTGPLTDYETYLSGLRPGQRPLVNYALIIDPINAAQQDRKADHLKNHPYWSDVLIPRLIQHFQESAYVKVEGNRPLVYSLNSAAFHSTAQGFGDCSKPNGPCWRSALDELVKRVKATPGLGAPYFVDARSDAQAATTLGFDGLSNYGPGVLKPVGCCNSGHQAWAGGPTSHSLTAIDNAVNTQTVVDNQGRMLAVQPALTATLDHRAQNVGTEQATKNRSSSTFWFEYPTYSEWEAHFRMTYDNLELYPGRSSDPGAILIYAWNEVSEGGGIVPTAQYGAYFLDAIRVVRDGSYPSEYWNTWNDTNTAIHYVGDWRYSGPAPEFKQTEQRYPTTPVPGAYGNDEHLDPNGATNTGDSATIDLNGVSSVRLIATKGPDRGIARVTVDGQAVDVDLYAPVTARQAIVLERDGLTKGRHRLSLSATGRANPAATAATIGIDAVSAAVSRLGASAPGLVAPARVTALGYASRVTVDWDPVVGASGYTVLRSASPDGPWQKLSRRPQTDQRASFEDATVPPGIRAWYYEVRALSGESQGPPGDVAPAITLDDLARAAIATPGQDRRGAFFQVMLAGGASQTFDEVVLAPAPSTPIIIEATSDGGATWKTVYRTEAPGAPPADLGERQWLTFPPVTASGLRVSTKSAQPINVQVYLR